MFLFGTDNEAERHSNNDNDNNVDDTNDLVIIATI